MALVVDHIDSAGLSTWQTPIDFGAVFGDGQIAQTAALPPATQVMRPEEPSSFALTLVGLGTLVIFRGVQKWVAPKQAAVRVVQPRIKPRRRAA